MPRYEFTCQDCSAPFEVRLSIAAYDAGEGKACPACGSTRVERRFTQVGVLTGSRTTSGGSNCCRGSGFT